MKALTLYQPWATLIAIDEKHVETRSWATSYRGPLAIHASKYFPKGAQYICFQEPFRSLLGDYVELGVPYTGKHKFPLGCVIAVCQLVDCIQITEERQFACTDIGRMVAIPPLETEYAFGDYTPGRYAWLLADIRRISEPLPARGKLGLWNWDMEAAVDNWRRNATRRNEENGEISNETAI